MKRFIVTDTFVVLLLILTVVKLSNGIKSSTCPRCDEHNLSCPSGQQIDISSAYHGFTLKDNTCKDCKEECCKYYKNDCLELYQGLEYGPPMRCCEPTIKPSGDSGWKEMSSLQVVIDGMKPNYCTYSIVSYLYNFFQTNTKGTSFRIHQNLMKSNVHYSVIGYSTFTTLPNTDVYIVVSGYNRLHTYDSGHIITVKYRCSDEFNESAIESTTMISAQTTERFMLNEVTEGKEDFLGEEANSQTREEYDNAQIKGEEKNENVLVGSLVGGVAGLCLVLLIVAFIIFIFKRRPKQNEVGINGLENPGYGADNISTVVPPGEITINNNNSTVEYLRDDVRFDTLPNIRYIE
ncbi:hypothetical protein LOTGIDRAFT_228901 [Lottia gigantea]|uniref:Uncharacterized protein n=1 Tax=Lottia gigantea TaxID=225164 RepID=V4BK47_LOTGI|nr:hypothetical protein LOTGIDRAFT_228901 [Lottia gigantea]ESO88929.1 hypothetical protein LOTGIDRAFT_228901 [Lottia gigantea]